MAGPGNLASHLPPRPDDFMRKQRDLERQQREIAFARTLQAAQFGAGGILVNGGGSVTIQDGGSLNVLGSGSINVPSGGLNSAGSISAATTITAGTSISAGGAISTTSGNISTANGSMSCTGTATAGGFSTGGSVGAAGVTATGDISTSSALRGADIYATNAPGFNITGTRVAGWWESATGRGGTASSSERFKTDIEAVGLDHLRAILSIDVVHFSYIDEVRKRDDPTFEGYVGPDYHVATNIGAIAERLHEAGLWEFVVYEHENVIEPRPGEPNEDGTPGEPVDVVVGDRLKLGDDGEPIPHAIHDILIAYSLLPIVADHDKRIAALEQRMDAAGL
jgi:hypothetical protein